MTKSTDITISVNDRDMIIEDASTLTQLFARLNINQPSGIAVAINNEVIPADNFETTPLNDRDRIQIFQAIHGG